MLFVKVPEAREKVTSCGTIKFSVPGLAVPGVAVEKYPGGFPDPAK